MEAAPTPDLKNDLNKNKPEKKKDIPKLDEQDKVCPRCKNRSRELIKLYAVSMSSKEWKTAVMFALLVTLAGNLLHFHSGLIFVFACVSVLPVFMTFSGKTFCPRCGNRAVEEMQDDDF